MQRVSHLEAASDEQPLEQLTDQHVSPTRIQTSHPEPPQGTTVAALSHQISPQVSPTSEPSSRDDGGRKLSASFTTNLETIVCRNICRHWQLEQIHVSTWIRRDLHRLEHNKHTSKFSAINIDLGSDDGQQVLWTLLASLKPHAMHAGVACGTSSRAREKELPEYLRRQGAPRPVPLRNDEHPLGIPNLSSFNAQKVEAANRLYELVFKLILYSFEHNIIFSPSRILGGRGCGQSWYVSQNAIP